MENEIHRRRWVLVAIFIVGTVCVAVGFRENQPEMRRGENVLGGQITEDVVRQAAAIRTISPRLDTAADRSAELQALFDRARDGDTIKVERGDYHLRRGLMWLGKAVDLDLRGARFYCLPGEVTAPLLTFGGHSGRRISGVQINGGTFNRGGGLCLQNLGYSRIWFESIYAAAPGLTIRADNEACAYLEFRYGSIAKCEGAIVVEQIGSGWANFNDFYRVQITCDGPYPMFATTNKNPKWQVGDWCFDRCDVECDDMVLFDAGNVSLLFRDTRFEVAKPTLGRLGPTANIRIVRPTSINPRHPALADPRVRVDP
jgi:hypothetical protein